MKYNLLIILLIPLLSFSQIKYTNKKSGLGIITDISNAGDGSNRIFVTNKGGIITILDQDYNTLGTLFDISSSINTTSEMGLLGLAFHPSFSSNGYFFVNYNPTGTRNTRISRFTASSPSGNSTVNLNTEKIILTITGAQNDNHKGGDLVFGPDGYLYIGTGDGGGGGDPQGSGQNGNTLLAKILRIDINTTDPYVIPATNPFISNPNVLNEIWDLGVRNPWRISFDRSNGDFWIADVGQNLREEINVETAGSGGFNYGWNCREGINGYPPSSCQNNGGFKDPIFDYTHCSGMCSTPGFGNSITGGFVYRGENPANASLKGYYIFADYVSRHAWILKQTSGGGGLDVKTIPRLTSNGITSFGELENGEIVAGQSNGDLGMVEPTIALPVRLTTFDAADLINKIQLSWSTASERNVHEYQIEKSKDGILFNLFTTLQALNLVTGNDYRLDDLHPFPGDNYYRLKIIDLDGSFEYSDMVRIKFNTNKAIYFNLASNEINFIGNWSGRSEEINVFTMEGRLIVQLKNSNSTVPISNLAAGIYLIQTELNNVPFVQKIFIPN
ncbi:MAG: PQQ-dependent sugar dehydrogenase [Saprospiraceae bacterium]